MQPLPLMGKWSLMALDRATIIDKAFEVLAEKGVEGLSTRKLAEALGVSGPSLYWHFKTKRELFDHMSEAMAAAAMLPLSHPPQDFDWPEWLADGARAIRNEMLSRPGSVQITVGYRPTAERIAAGPPASMLVLARTGLTLNESRAILGIVSRFVIGWTLDEETASSASKEDRDRAFEFALGIVVKGARVQVDEILAARAETVAS